MAKKGRNVRSPSIHSARNLFPGILLMHADKMRRWGTKVGRKSNFRLDRHLERFEQVLTLRWYFLHQNTLHVHMTKFLVLWARSTFFPTLVLSKLMTVTCIMVDGFSKDLLIYRNWFYVSVRLFSNRSQITSKCGKKKKSGSWGAAVCTCVTYVFTTC